MVSERIDDSPYAPTKGLVIHRPDDSGSCGNDALESHVRIVMIRKVIRTLGQVGHIVPRRRQESQTPG